MIRSHTSCQAPPDASPPGQPPMRWWYTPTPDGFERFIWACVGLSRDDAAQQSARCTRPQLRSTLV
jgi:hypothetical protein